MKARRLAAVTSGIPWSIEAGIRWVPMRPLVLAPQMKNDPASNQKLRFRAPIARPPSAARTGFCSGGAGSSASVAPYARSPTSAGRSRMNSATSGIPSSAAPATTSADARHPKFTASHASAGRKISCPVAPAAVKAPSTRPRRWTNQRFATMAASTVAIEPVPTPTTTPHSRSSCHGWCMKTVSPDPADTAHKAAGKRCEEAEQHQVEGARDRDRCARPSELVLEGDDQDAGRRANPRRAQQREPGDSGHDPAVMEAPHLKLNPVCVTPFHGDGILEQWKHSTYPTLIPNLAMPMATATSTSWPRTS